MSSKIILSTILLSGFGLLFCATSEARGRGRCGCNGGGDVYGTYTAQATGDRRLYSYEPDAGNYYVNGGTLTRSNVPRYLLPKSDPRKYDAR